MRLDLWVLNMRRGGEGRGGEGKGGGEERKGRGGEDRGEGREEWKEGGRGGERGREGEVRQEERGGEGWVSYRAIHVHV